MSLNYFFCLALVCAVSTHAAPFTIMIDPAGNARNPGRLIDTIHEQTITLNCAEALKKEIEAAIPEVSVILTRTPGNPAHTANYAQRANTLNVSLFISLNAYQETDSKPHLYLYQFLYNNEPVAKPSSFTFYKEEQSYLFNHASSENVAHIIQKTCNQKPHAQQFITHAVIGYPCAPLKGIIVPALALDMGIKQQTDWSLFIAPIVESIRIIAQKAVLS